MKSKKVWNIFSGGLLPSEIRALSIIYGQNKTPKNRVQRSQCFV